MNLIKSLSLLTINLQILTQITFKHSELATSHGKCQDHSELLSTVTISLKCLKLTFKSLDSTNWGMKEK